MSRKGLWTVSFGFGIAFLAIVSLIVIGALNRGAQAQAASQTPSLQVDMDPTNGSGPCNPIDSNRVTQAGETYAVAVCLVDAPSAPAAFAFDLAYDDTTNSCVVGSPSSEMSPALDSNPDANAGLTFFSSPDLGLGFNCALAPEMQPACDLDPATGPDHGAAVLICLTHDSPTLPIGAGVASPLAAVTLVATSDGTDSFSIPAAVVFGADGTEYIKPPPSPDWSPGICISFGSGTCPPGPTPTATFTATPTATPTDTRTPTATNTPSPHPAVGSVGGKVLLPPAALADASSEPSGPSDGRAAIWAALVGIVALTAALGGWHAKFRKRT